MWQEMSGTAKVKKSQIQTLNDSHLPCYHLDMQSGFPIFLGSPHYNAKGQ
jgi:hypothetical protein